MSSIPCTTDKGLMHIKPLEAQSSPVGGGVVPCAACRLRRSTEAQNFEIFHRYPEEQCTVTHATEINRI
ncbi:hypothetical protein TNCV_2244841 [Trichonephila clavipes]|nr:hypothetical protein TNCV_2244841 [Trichonephila clavipes]